MMAIEQALRAALLHFVWQGFVVALFLWIALLLMRKRSANARYLASCLALAVLAALPVVTASALYQQPAELRASGDIVSSVPRAVVAVWTGSGTAAVSWLAWFERWAVPIWSLGVMLLSLRLVWGCRQLSLLRRSGTPADGPVLAMVNNLRMRLGLARPVRVMISTFAESAGPSVIGWLRPIILLPAATIVGLTPEQLEAVLAHEFAHIKRYDYLVNILQIAVETLLFYHPAVWWTSARIRDERELCCDDLAVHSCGDALCYARALTRLERLRVLAPRLALGSADGPLLHRIQRLTGQTSGGPGPSKLPGILALCFGVLCLALNLNWAHGNAQDLRPAQPKAQTAAPVITDAKGVSVDLGGAAVVQRVPVDYPGDAIDEEVEGSVQVEAALDNSGHVREARALSGPQELREAVLASVRQWIFKADPAHLVQQLSVAFQLPKEECDADVDDDNDTDMDNDVDIDVDMDNDHDVDEAAEVVEIDMPDLDNDLHEAEAALEQAESELNDKSGDFAAKLAEAQHELEKLKDKHVLVLEGRRLKRIRTVGFSDVERMELIKRLPVHEGDKLASDSLEKVEKAVTGVDPNVAVMTISLEDDDVAILIVNKKGINNQQVY